MKPVYKKRFLFVIGGLLLLIAINLFITYSYFQAEIIGVESASTIDLDIGYMTVTYDNLSDNLVADNIYPGWTTTKKFSIKGNIPNETTNVKYSELYYVVKLVLDNNDLLDNSMAYSLSLDSTSGTAGQPFVMSGYIGIPSKTNANEIVLGYGKLPKGENTHIYNLKLEYLDRADVDQIGEMGAKFSAHVVIDGVNPDSMMNITLDYNDNDLDTVDMLVVKNSTIVLPTLKKDYWQFLGWEILSGTANLSGNNLELFEGPVSLKAKWNKAGINAIEYIANLYNNDASTNGLELDSTDDQNIRYTGPTPKNYVTFANEGELWRIVGIFNVQDTSTSEYKQKIKLVRDDSLGYYSWDTSASTVNDGNGVNSWSQADLMQELNSDYINLNLTVDKKWYNGTKDIKNQKTGVFHYTNVIKEKYQNMISMSVWNLGGNVWNNPADAPFGLDTKGQYIAERGTEEFGSGRDVIWEEKVGLIYPSDYGYASTDAGCRTNLRNGAKYVNGSYDYSGVTCKNYNWLHNGTWYWTITPSRTQALYVNGNGLIDSANPYTTLSVRPSVYLNPDIKFFDGNGTSLKPYILGL